MASPSPHTHIIENLRSHQKISFALIKITNTWLGEEETMDYRFFHFIFNIRFSIFCTKQNTKEIMKLFHEEDVIFS